MIRYYLIICTVFISVFCWGKALVLPSSTSDVDTVFRVTFVVVDGSTAVSGTTVTLSGYGSQLSDVNGNVVFDTVSPAENIVYTAYKDGYDEVIDSLSVTDAAVSKIIYMTQSAESYSVNFLVKISSTPVEGAKVYFEGYGTKYTDASGIATFTKVTPGYTLPYTVTVSGYSQYVSALDVIDQDVTENVVFSLPSYNVRFVVNSIDHLLSGAIITLDGYGSKTTDKNGKAQFLNVSQAENIPYTITALWHDDYSGTVTVSDQDITETIYMTGIADVNSADFLIYPNPANDNVALTINYKGKITLFNLEGKVVSSFEVNYEQLDFSVMELPKGIYIIQLTTPEFTKEKKLIIN